MTWPDCAHHALEEGQTSPNTEATSDPPRRAIRGHRPVRYGRARWSRGTEHLDLVHRAAAPGSAAASSGRDEGGSLRSMPSSADPSVPSQTIAASAADAGCRRTRRLWSARHHGPHAGRLVRGLPTWVAGKPGHNCLAYRVGPIGARRRDGWRYISARPSRSSRARPQRRQHRGRRFDRRFRCQQCRIQAVGFNVDPQALGDDIGVIADRLRGLRRTGERDHIAGPKRVEQVASTAAERGQRAVGQHRP